MQSRPFAALVTAALLTAAAPGRPALAQTAPPRPGSPPLRLSLSEATALALRRQPTIRAADQSRLAAEARIPQARSSYLPRLDWVTGADTGSSFSRSLGGSIRTEGTQSVIQGRQLLYDFGKTASLVEEATANARVSVDELERVREVVVQNVRQAYFGLLQARRLVTVADANLARSELNLRSAQGFFDVGTKPKSDVTKAEVEVANARVLVIRARNSVRLSESTLANTLGLEATTPIEVDDILIYEPVALDAGALLAEALANRPELRQAQSRLDAARSALAGARAAFWPDLYATASGGVASNQLETSEPQGQWAVGVTLAWNLFQGYFTTHRVKEQEALVETARANAETIELQVRLEVEQAQITVIEAAERIGATAKAVESAQENLRLAQGRYDAGVGTILELTDAQLSLSTAEADHVRALTDFRVGLAVLDRVVGRQ